MGSTTTASMEDGGAAESTSADSQPIGPQRSVGRGLDALSLIARLHHIAADADQLAHQLGWPPSHTPSTADLLLAAQHLGLKAKLNRTSIERLALTPLPALALLKTDDDHVKVVVLAQCDGQRVLFQDPGGEIQGGRPTIEPIDVFASQWTGELILITSRASLAGELAKFDFSWFIPSIVKYRRLLGEVLVISLFLQLFALVSPLFFQVVMDKVLVHRGLTTLDVLVAGLVVIVLFESVLTILRTYTFSHTTSRIDVELGARLFRHLLNLPLAYFQSRRVGDSVARVRELENIRSFLTGNALTLVLDVVFSVIFIAIMFAYSVPLTLIVLVSLPLYLALSLTLMPILRTRLNEKFARGAENQALLVEAVTGIQTVKASALEPAMARRWDGQLAAYVVDNVGDVVTERAFDGTDTVESSVTWTLGNAQDHLTLTGSGAINGTGNSLANTIRGNAGDNVLSGGTNNDTLIGGAGSDTLIGGTGNDTFVVDAVTDVVIENANEGTDLVQSSATWTLSANVENLTLTGTAAINGTGNTLANTLTGNGANNMLVGDAGNDSLNGGSGDDVLNGGSGNDTLYGGSGSDTMLGGTGDDIYSINVAADVVTEYSGEGIDTVQVAFSYALGANVENLTLTSTYTANGAGNELDNVLLGNRAVNTLTGGAGNDTLDGAAGTDTLVGGTGADRYLFGRGYGVDTIQENDSTAGITDVVQFGSGIVAADLIFSHVGNNLEVAIAGTSDKVVVQNWYLGTQYRVEQFKLADGTIVSDTQVPASLTAGPASLALDNTTRETNLLIDAMAAFNAPAAGSSSVPLGWVPSRHMIMTGDLAASAMT